MKLVNVWLDALKCLKSLDIFALYMTNFAESRNDSYQVY